MFSTLFFLLYCGLGFVAGTWAWTDAQELRTRGARMMSSQLWFALVFFSGSLGLIGYLALRSTVWKAQISESGLLDEGLAAH